MVELQSPLPPALGHLRRDVDEQAFLFVLAEEQPNLPGSPRCSQPDVSPVLPVDPTTVETPFPSPSATNSPPPGRPDQAVGGHENHHARHAPLPSGHTSRAPNREGRRTSAATGQAT